MKRLKVIAGLAIIAIIGCILASVVGARREAALQQAELQRVKIQRIAELEQAAKQAPSAKMSVVSEPTALAAPSTTEAKQVPAPAKPAAQATPAGKQPVAAKASQAPAPSQKQWQDPDARLALSFVGAFPEADQYWFLAINDANLPPKERQDLIEDLNEEGFPDPKNLTAEDLPLILSRIELIEEIGADAMDKVNADAFQEAYKDLVNMAARLLR